jgi:hypothetical protein
MNNSCIHTLIAFTAEGLAWGIQILNFLAFDVVDIATRSPCFLQTFAIRNREGNDCIP